MEIVDIHFPLLKFPGSMLIQGSTHSGKTTLVHSIFQHKDVLFTVVPQQIIYCYTEIPGTLFDDIDNILTHQGLPDLSTLNGWLETYEDVPWLLCLDDMQLAFYNSEICEQLMTRSLHHKGCYLLVTGHNLFAQGKHGRLANLQYHSMLLCRSVRDLNQLSILGVQLLAKGKSASFIQIFLDATQMDDSERPKYLYVGLHPLYTSRDSMFFARILPGDGDMVLYTLT